MKVRGSTSSSRLVRGALVAFSATALAVTGATGATSANAQQLSPDRAADAVAGQAELRAAMERDLDLSGAALDEYLADAAAATTLDAQLREQLSEEPAGTWFDRDSGTLRVAVTSAEAAAQAAEAGAEPVQVRYSAQELAAVTDRLDGLVEEDPAALSQVYDWGVQPELNQVVVTVAEGHADAVRPLLADYGDAVTIEESAHAPEPLQDYPWLDGGIPYNGCSVGFNARNTSTGERYFLTAGHCGSAGQSVTGGNGQPIGQFVASFYPTYDDALVQVTNTSYWSQGPYVYTWPGFISVSGHTDAPVGTPTCKSGRTTQYTCGSIVQKDVTANYGNGPVYGLTEHDACAEPGDSGGSTVNVSGTPAAEGFTSGGALSGGQCLPTPVTYYFPIADSLPYYSSAYGISLY